MATLDSAYVKNQLHGGRGVTVSWAGLSVNDDGIWQQLVLFKYKCLHIFGTFNGAIAYLEGTNEDAQAGVPTSPIHLTDSLHQEIAVTTPGILHVFENPLYMRPIVVGGDGDTDLTFLLVCRP